MKKNKIIGIAIATLGMAVSFGSAIALYTRAANNANIGISQGTYTGSTGTVTYKINGNTSGEVAPSYLDTEGNNGGTGLYIDDSTNESYVHSYTQVKYEFALSAEYASDVIEQDVVVGNISLSITSIPTKWQGKLDIWAGIDGYEAGSIGEHYYANALMTTDYHITSENVSYSGNADIAVSRTGEQKLVVYLKYNLTGMSNLDLNEESLGYSLSVTWAKASAGFGFANVVGTGNKWQADDEYAMAPDIGAAYGTDSSQGQKEWNWVFYNLPGTFGSAKCLIGETWSSGSDETLDASKTYDVYWTGNGTDQAYFTAQ